MGNACIWYTPSGGTLQKIDLGYPLSDLQPVPIRDARRSFALSGRMYSADYGGKRQLRAVLEGINSAATVRALRSFQSHAQSGGLFALAADEDKQFLGYVQGSPQPGATTLRTLGNPLRGYNSSAVLASGDEVVIESDNPERHIEHHEVSAFGTGGTSITLSSGLLYKHESKVVWVREFRFFPALRLADEHLTRPFLTHDHGLVYTLDLACIEDPSVIQILSNLSSGEVADSSGGGGKPSIEDFAKKEIEKGEKPGVDPKTGWVKKK